MTPQPEITLPTSFGIAAYPPGASFGPRLMQDWEFVWLIQGDAEYCWDGFAALEGSVVLCRPGGTDFFQWDRHRRTRHAFFHFQMTTPADDRDEWPLVRGPEENDILLPLFQYVLTWLGRGTSEPCAQAIAMMLAVFRTGDRTTGQLTLKSWPPAVERVCAYISQRLEDDPSHPISLKELGDIACMTPEHLCRLFQAFGLYSPVETVRRVRLDRTATLLARSNYSVGEIAALCGFVSPFHFSRLFRSAYGLPPTEFRRRVQAGEIPFLPRHLLKHQF